MDTDAAVAGSDTEVEANRAAVDVPVKEEKKVEQGAIKTSKAQIDDDNGLAYGVTEVFEVQSDVNGAGSDTEVEVGRAVIDVPKARPTSAHVEQQEKLVRDKPTSKSRLGNDEDNGLAYGIAEGIGDDDEPQDFDGLDYGEALSRVSTIPDKPQIVKSTPRSIEIGLVDAGHAVEENSGSDTEVPDDTSTTGYDADSSEAEPGPGPAFNRSRYDQVTGGMSEMSLFDTAVCVGFGYALVYAV